LFIFCTFRLPANTWVWVAVPGLSGHIARTAQPNSSRVGGCRQVLNAGFLLLIKILSQPPGHNKPNYLPFAFPVKNRGYGHKESSCLPFLQLLSLLRPRGLAGLQEAFVGYLPIEP
jgi:hypothetical protein